MYGTLSQIPDQPGIHRTEKQFSPLCPFSDTGYIIQDPGNLGSTEISIRDQAGLLPDDLIKAVFFSSSIISEVRRHCHTIALYTGSPVFYPR